MFDAAWFYDMFFSFRETGAINDNFGFLGIENKNFILNSGSYFPFVLVILAGAFSNMIA